MSPRLAEVRVNGIDRPLRLHLHSENDRYISEEIATLGQWESLETEVVRRLLGPGSLLLDCGANIGWYTVIGGAIGADVFAFEPEPNNLALLHQNILENALQDRVTVHPVALGRQAGTLSLQLSADNQGDHRLSERPVGHTIDVQVERLDDVDIPRTPDVVKVDTQGSEVSILRGGFELLAAERLGATTLILEFWPFGLRHCGASAEELIGLLTPIVGVSHVCLELSSSLNGLRPRTLAELAIMAAQGPMSPAEEGHTNIVVLPISKRAMFDDLVVSTTEPITVASNDEAIERQLQALAATERSSSSQNGEDGVIEHLARLTSCPRVMVELGAGDGSECNSAYPRNCGWRVAAFDGDPESSNWVRRAFLTAENVNVLLDEEALSTPIGVLSIDLDGNDFWLLHQLEDRFLPMILVVEYNGTLGPVNALSVPYRARRRWDHSNFFGASLAAFTLLAHARGMSLVYCESRGVNAFFVSHDHLERAGLHSVGVERAYRPPRYGAVDALGLHTGHAPTARRFVRVDSLANADAAFAATRGHGPGRWLRIAHHHVATSEIRRFWRTWVNNGVSAIRGNGPTK